MKRLVTGSVFVLFVMLFGACEPAGKTDVSASEINEVSFADLPIASWKTDLLDLAFSGVSQMPLHPHIKNRSRAQQKIVDLCLELKQPTLAYSYALKIENWQRWMGLSNLAIYLAEDGQTAASKTVAEIVNAALHAANNLHSGRVVASTPNPLIDTLEDRRYQAVLARMAEFSLLNASNGLIDVDAEKYGEVNASSLAMTILPSGADHVEQNLAALRIVTEDPNFEIVHLGLLEMAGLVDRNYDSVELSALLDKDVFPILGKKIPVFVRIDVLRAFAEAAIRHEDFSGAHPLLEKMDGMIEGLKSSPRYYIPEAARLARVRLDAGESQMAEDQLRLMESVYEEKKGLIVDIERAGLLCHLAETSFYLGHRPQALTFYAQAIAEGQRNPNSRPRADDLNRICCSMVRSGVEPTGELFRAIEQMKSGLGEPW